MRTLLSYSKNFSMALALWPLASLVLTLPILAFLYHRDGRLKLWSAAGAYLAVFYALGLVCFTLYPLPTGTSGPGISYGVKPQLDIWRFVSDIRSDGFSAVFQLAANVALFVPLGFILARGLGWGPVLSTLGGFAVSLLIETTQLTGIFGHYAYAYRTFDVDDLLTNTTGALVGWVLAAILAHFAPKRIDPEALVPTHEPGLVRRLVAFAIDMALTWGFAAIVCAVAQYFLLHYVPGTGRAAQALELLIRWSFRGSLVIFELLVPLAARGRTLGGAFVRMTCETHRRRGGLRLLFFVFRFAVIYLVVRYAILAVPVLAVFWFAIHEMPYDLLPASKVPGSAGDFAN